MNNQIILGVLASGRGSDLQSIIDAIENGQIKTKIGVVLTDKPEAMALIEKNVLQKKNLNKNL